MKSVFYNVLGKLLLYLNVYILSVVGALKLHLFFELELELLECTYTT